MVVGAKELTYWWRDAIIYQVWPASFKDSNGDGIGDLPGIISKLDYIKALGANTIWMSPHYASPRIDEGYDISDYKAIHPPFGTMDDMDKLIAETKARGLRLILDLVINHTSDQHAWFKESRSSRDNPKRDWYIWRDAKKGPNGERLPPNNWRNNFNGSAWTWDETTQQYYLHLFCPEQPDLNWTSEACRKQIYDDAMIFWLEKGIDGFRVDTVNMYSKPMDFPDAPVIDPTNAYQPAQKLYCNGPEMHKYLTEMGQILARYDAMTVGELPCTPNTADVMRYVSAKNQELSMVFQFDVVDIDRGIGQHFFLREWKLKEVKDAIFTWQKFIIGNDSWTTIFTENHDQPRSISRYCSDKPEYRVQAGKMLALLQSSLTGTQFIYQGQEIGMTNFSDEWPAEEYKDIDSTNFLKWFKQQPGGDDPAKFEAAKKKVNRIARDNARTPVQWTSEPHAGFTTGKPWMRVNDNYTEVNVEDEERDPKSVLAFWRKCVALRTQQPHLLGRGEFEEFDYENPHTISFIKNVGPVPAKSEFKHAFAVGNFTADEQEIKFPDFLQGKNTSPVLSTNAANTNPSKLGAYEGRLYLV